MISKSILETGKMLAQGKIPKLFVFDLDYTLWAFDCGRNIVPPFKLCSMFGTFDYYGRPANLPNEVKEIITALVDNDIPIAIASRNSDINCVVDLMKHIPIKCKKGDVTLFDVITNMQVYSSDGTGAKNKHFAEIKKATDIGFDQMVFFDDLPENVHAAQRQGTTSILVGRRGLCWDNITEALTMWRLRMDSLQQTLDKQTQTDDHGQIA